VDLLLFGAARIHTERLVVPHPAIHERAFVLVPLLEIAPALRDPVTGEPYRASLDRLQTAGVSYFRAWDG
jgi:2-amino-4-hydroxy-6-hydroxymethyldihydropteridine diphosphokinase